MNGNLKNKIANLRNDFNKKVDNINWSIKRISLQTVVRPVNTTDEDVQIKQTNNRGGIQMKRPKNLFLLLHKYEFGKKMKDRRIITVLNQVRYTSF